MAQESQGGRADSGRSGSRKRRYFRRKPGERTNQGDAPGAAPEKSARTAPDARAKQPPAQNTGDRIGRTGNRRRRKSKGRRSEAGREQSAAVQAQEIDYVPPTSVYIYTHIVRPSTSTYEFRSEHFSKVGRTLDDYDIDVAPLFDAEARAKARPNMAEIFADFDMGEDEVPPAPPVPPEAPAASMAPVTPAESAASIAPEPPLAVEHMDANLLEVGGETGLPTYAENPYGAEDTAPADEDEPDGAPDIAIE